MSPVPSQIMSVGLLFLGSSWSPAHEGKWNRRGGQVSDSHEGKNFRESTSESEFILLSQA